MSVNKMSRYVDADALLSNLPDELPYKASVKRVLMQAPTVDVVPRAEVDELIGKLECLLCHATGGRLSKHTYDLRTMETVVTDCVNETYNDGFAEGAREILAEIEQEILKAIDNNLQRMSEQEEANEIWRMCVAKKNTLCGMYDFIGDLKKKYTEGKK